LESLCSERNALLVEEVLLIPDHRLL